MNLIPMLGIITSVIFLNTGVAAPISKSSKESCSRELLNEKPSKLTSSLQEHLSKINAIDKAPVQILMRIRKDHLAAFQQFVFSRKKHLFEAQDSFIQSLARDPSILASEKRRQDAFHEAFTLSIQHNMQNNMMSDRGLWNAVAMMPKRYGVLDPELAKTINVAKVQIGELNGEHFHELLVGVSERVAKKSKYYNSPYFRYQLNSLETMASKLMESWGVSSDQIRNIRMEKAELKTPEITESSSLEASVQTRYEAFADEFIAIEAKLTKGQIELLASQREVLHIQHPTRQFKIPREVLKEAESEKGSREGFYELLVALPRAVKKVSSEESAFARDGIDELFAELLGRGIRPLSLMRLDPQAGAKLDSDKDFFIVHAASNEKYLQELKTEQKNVIGYQRYQWNSPWAKSVFEVIDRYFWAVHFGLM